MITYENSLAPFSTSNVGARLDPKLANWQLPDDERKNAILFEELCSVPES
jgi:hypothetical protein